MPTYFIPPQPASLSPEELEHMFNEILDFRVDCIANQQTGIYTLIISVWDGTICVANARYELTEYADVKQKMFAFVKYWSLLYFDSPEFTRVVYDENGNRQMTLDDAMMQQ
jgi:hypothetical protein